MRPRITIARFRDIAVLALLVALNPLISYKSAQPCISDKVEIRVSRPLRADSVQLEEMRYYFRNHKVTDEGYNLIAQYYNLLSRKGKKTSTSGKTSSTSSSCQAVPGRRHQRGLLEGGALPDGHSSRSHYPTRRGGTHCQCRHGGRHRRHRHPRRLAGHLSRTDEQAVASFRTRNLRCLGRYTLRRFLAIRQARRFRLRIVPHSSGTSRYMEERALPGRKTQIHNRAHLRNRHFSPPTREGPQALFHQLERPAHHFARSQAQC